MFGTTVFLAVAEVPAQDRPGRRPVEVVSPEVSAERKIKFRIHAPKAASVQFESSDIPNTMLGVKMTKTESGIWETAIGPLASGAYRYNFRLDGVSVTDPNNPATSEANNTLSIVYIE
jgi:enterochelin esterase family protein